MHSQELAKNLNEIIIQNMDETVRKYKKRNIFSVLDA